MKAPVALCLWMCATGLTPAFTSTDVAGTSTSASTTLLPHPVIKETTDHSSLATTTPTTITNETAGSLFTSTGLVSNQTTGNSSLVNSTGLVSNETTGNSSLVNSTGLVSNEMTGNSSMANSTGLVSKETADNSSLVNSTTDSTSPAPNTTHVSSTTPGINETQVTTNTSSTSTSQISNPTASTTASAVIQQDTRRGKPGNSTTDGIVSQKIRPLSGSAVAVAVIGTIVVLGLLVGALVWKKRERYTRLDEDQPVGSQSNYTNPVYGL